VDISFLANEMLGLFWSNPITAGFAIENPLSTSLNLNLAQYMSDKISGNILIKKLSVLLTLP
jgi:hypothetical protein